LIIENNNIILSIFIIKKPQVKFYSNNILNNVDINWSRRLAGFVDAEGSFSIVEISNRNTIRFFFRIVLHKDDIQVFNIIANTLNLNKPRIEKKNKAVLAVTSTDQIVNIILPMSNDIALLTTKLLDFQAFSTAINLKLNNGSTFLTKENRERILILKNEMNSKRIHNVTFNILSESINANWLLGFIEGEGTFGYKNLVPYFQIAQLHTSKSTLNATTLVVESIKPTINSPLPLIKPKIKISLNKRTNVYSYVITDIDESHPVMVPFLSSLEFKTRKYPKGGTLNYGLLL
jgi:hypothetical protein